MHVLPMHMQPAYLRHSGHVMSWDTNRLAWCSCALICKAAAAVHDITAHALAYMLAHTLPDMKDTGIKRACEELAMFFLQLTHPGHRVHKLFWV